MDIIRIPLEDLTPDPSNAKDHPAWQIEQIKNSIETFGNLDPIGVWGDQNLIVEGHGRYEALKELGYQEAECIRLDWLTDEERRAYALAHNKLTMNSGFIPDALDLNLEAVGEIDMSLFGFELPEDMDPTEIVEDEAPEEAEPRCKTGDVWQLGEHRLMCGDATDSACVDKLMRGATADIAITSPPYGAANAARIRDHYVAGAETQKSFYRDYEDSPGTWRDLIEAAFQNMQSASLGQFINIQMLADNKADLVGFIDRHAANLCDVIVWDKGKAPPQMQARVLNNQFEFVFVFENVNGSRTIPFSNFHGNVSNIIKVRTGINEFADIHRAVYPVELVGEILNIAIDAKTVFDCFGGTGTTMIACEQLGRKCYMMEMDPHYCDVIIERWENFTGGKAVLLNDEITHRDPDASRGCDEGEN